jgi:hypothetical protein
MDLGMYMSMLIELREERPKIEIGEAALLILSHFVHRKFSSTYQIYSELKKSPSSMAYKNVHKRIQRLEALKLIQKVKVKESQHGAKFYQLSEAGLYHLFLNFSRPSFVLRFPTILENYGELAFFNVFLYPYFERKTLMSINKLVGKPMHLFEDFNVILVFAIVSHLRMCCAAVQDFFSRLDRQLKLEKVKKDYSEELAKELAALDNEITLRSYFLLFRMMWSFAISDDAIFDTIKTMSVDNKFMSKVDELHAIFEKGYKKCMDIRQKS